MEIYKVSAYGSELCVNQRGEVCSFINSGRQYIWNGNEKFWGWHSPTLFPYVGRLKDEKTSFFGKTVEGLKIHGFLRNLTHTLVSKGEDFVEIKVTSSNETLKSYPFSFSFITKYGITEDGYFSQFTIVNEGDDDMPFNVGSHPAFMLDGALDENIFYIEGTDNAVYTSSGKTGLFNKSAVLGVVSESGVKLNYSIFDNGGMIFNELGQTKIAKVINEKSGEGFGIRFDEFPCCVTWSPSGDCPFFCVEPWVGLPDDVNGDGAFENKHYIQILKKGEKKTFRYDFFTITNKR